MNPSRGQRWMPVVIVGALMAAAAIASAIRGSAEAALGIALTVGLFMAYLVRHRMRARLVYGRPANARDESSHPPVTEGRPAPATPTQGWPG